MQKQSVNNSDVIVGVPAGQSCGNCYYCMIHKYIIYGIIKDDNRETKVCMRYPEKRYGTSWCGEWKKK